MNAIASTAVLSSLLAMVGGSGVWCVGGAVTVFS